MNAVAYVIKDDVKLLNRIGQLVIKNPMHTPFLSYNFHLSSCNLVVDVVDMLS